MAKKGLKEWLDEKWVDIGAPKKNGKYQPCGRQKGSKRAYPKCVPLEASAVKRKRAVSNKGPKPTNVKTFAKDGGMIGQAQRTYRGSYIDGSLGGVQVSNPSLKKYYKGML
jgi:hypothetical protein